MMTTELTTNFLDECKTKLIGLKEELLNNMREQRLNYNKREKGGDEADQALAALAEKEFLRNQDRMRFQVLEVDAALGRIQAGTYGICEETDEDIEIARLKALPWTRLSLEGAEIREALDKRYNHQTLV